jgi:hypothetical protein
MKYLYLNTEGSIFWGFVSFSCVNYNRMKITGTSYCFCLKQVTQLQIKKAKGKK